MVTGGRGGGAVKLEVVVVVIVVVMMCLRDRVLVFGEEPVDLVHDFAREVADGKCSGLRFHVVEVRVFAVHLLDLLSVRAIAPLREDALLRQRSHQRVRTAGDQLDHGDVVGVFDRLDVDALLAVARRRRVEEDADEEPLQLLVGEVDAELLERVGLEDLEAEDVDKPDRVRRRRRAAAVDLVVDRRHQPREDRSVPV